MQVDLFGRGEPRADDRFAGIRRLELEDGAWVEHAREWLRGHQALYARLSREARFTAHRRRMYDRVVDVPRLLARAPRTGEAAAVLRHAASLLEARYGLLLPSITLAHYRDGRDSVAMHGDKMGSLTSDTVVATLSLGHPRRFVFRSVRGGASRALTLGWGDLFVMGGSFQRSHLHGVPKTAEAGGRIVVMFRPEVPERDASAERTARRAVLGAQRAAPGVTDA